MENKDNGILELGFILKKLWISKFIIILSTLVIAAGALAYSIFLVEPKYKSTTKVYVVSQNKKDAAVTAQDIQLGNFLVKDYKEIILSNQVMTEVVEKNNLNISAAALTKKTSVDAPKDTRVLSITVEDTDPKVASELANSVREVSAEQIKKITKIDDVTTFEEAKPALAASSPNVVKNGILAGLVGFVLAIMVLVLKELIDDRVKRPEDVEEVMGMVLLGVVPDTKK